MYVPVYMCVFQEEVKIGPMSVGYNLTSRALCFGGDTCTATDLAVAAGVAKGDLLITAPSIILSRA